MSHTTPLGISPELSQQIDRFEVWRSRLAARVTEAGAGQLFGNVLSAGRPGDILSLYDLMYKFFRAYVTIPAPERKKFEDLASELEDIFETVRRIR